jgi:putative transposase
MVKPLSMDLRERAMARVAAGEPIRAIAAALGVGASSVSKWSTRLKATGTVAPGKMGGHVPLKLSGTHAQWLRERMAASDFTLRGLKAELAERNVSVDYRTVWKFVHREKLTYKKKRIASRAGSSPDCPQAAALAGSPGQD